REPRRKPGGSRSVGGRGVLRTVAGGWERPPFGLSPSSGRSSVVRRIRRGRVPVAALVVGLIVAGVLPFVLPSAANALPKQCDNGLPPPCTNPTTTTRPTTTTTPPPPTWFANISILDQSPNGFNRTVWGGWVEDGSPRYVTPSPNVSWNNAEQNEGTLGLPSTYLPPNGDPIGFWLRELGAEHLCRSNTGSAVPPSGRQVHILAAPQASSSTSEVENLASSFLGVITPPPDGAKEVRINSIDLVPQDGYLFLVMTGHLKAGT